MSLSGIAYSVVSSLSVVVGVLIGMAYLTLAERKVMATIQRRRGPNVVGLYGLFQPLADGLKLFVKEMVIPSSANEGLFLLAPILTFSLALCGWVVMPVGFGEVLGDLNVGVLYLFAVSALGVYGVILAGWSSNSKYAFLGALRSTAQMVSYEVSLGFIISSVSVCVGSLNSSEVVLSQEGGWYVFGLFPLFLGYCIGMLAETNRHPFDLPEAEAELVSGYNVEYSGMGFALFFLGEYTNMILMSGSGTSLFLGGWSSVGGSWLSWIPGSIWFGSKTLFFLLIFIWARAGLPRYRYDQLMRLGWKVLLPVSSGSLVFVSGILFGFNGLSS